LKQIGTLNITLAFINEELKEKKMLEISFTIRFALDCRLGELCSLQRVCGRVVLDGVR
jgi:hypothetical protein